MITIFKKRVLFLTSALLLAGTSLFGDYYVIVNNQKKGPLTLSEIQQMAQDGQVNKNSLVWQNGMKNWGKAGEQQELTSLFLPVAPPPLPSKKQEATPPPAPKISSSQTVMNSDDNQNELSNANTLANVPVETLNDWKREFENKFDVKIGVTEGGKTFFFGQTTVRVSPFDPAYGKELALSYDKAMLNLQGNFILQQYGNFEAQAISDFFEDDSTNAREFSPVKLKKSAKAGKLSLMLDKAVDILDNKLDKMLKDQGVPSEEIQKQTIEQKKLLFKDNFSKSMVKKAFGNMVGLVPVQTKIVTHERDGKTTVQLGIIAVMSEKTIQFARDIVKRRPTLVHGKAHKLQTILPKSDDAYLDEIGLRFVYDSRGRPMLLSYGRWSVVGHTSNAARYERKIQNAKEEARMFAESYIGNFMKTNIGALQSVDTESVNEEVATKITEIEHNKVANATENSQSIGETIDKSFKKLTSNSKFKLRGTSQVDTWEAKDKNGILHVGSVVTWSYKQLNNANAIDNIGKKKKTIHQSLKHKKRTIHNISRESKVVNSMDDF